MKKFILYSNFLLGFLVLFASVSIIFTKTPAVGQTDPVRIPADQEWYYADGTPADLSDIQYTSNHASVSRKINAEQLQSANLCFIASNINLSILLDDRVIYNYDPEHHPLYGTANGNGIFIVDIPYFTGEATLTIQLEDTCNGTMWAGISDLYFQGGADYLLSSVRTNFVTITLSHFMLCIGFLLIFSSLFLYRNSEQQLELLSLGNLAETLSLWIVSGIYLTGLLAENPGQIRMINYLALITLTIPWITLIACLTDQIESRIVFTVIGLSYFNLILHFVGLISNRLDYHDLLPLTHLIFLITVFASIYLFIHKKKGYRSGQKNMFFVHLAYFILMASGIADFVFYYIIDTPGANRLASFSRFSRFGYLFFVIILASNEIHEFILMAHKNREMNIMRHLAHEDPLTGVENRLSFNEYENKLQKKETEKCIYIEFDINNLKKTNDYYGHPMGDALIKAGANAIKESFGQYGRVFRTGGDEFAAIILLDDKKTQPTDLYRNCEDQLAKCIAAYNAAHKPAIPLSIAYGMAECDFSKDDLLSKEILADKKMYEHKKKLKQEIQSR